jgi:hypothetical protein
LLRKSGEETVFAQQRPRMQKAASAWRRHREATEAKRRSCAAA